MNKDTPFSMSFVFQKTFMYIDNTINYSIKKTSARLEGLGNSEEDNKKRSEIFDTIAGLNKLSKMIIEFKENNPKLFKVKEKEIE